MTQPSSRKPIEEAFKERKFELIDIDSVDTWDRNPRKNKHAIEEVKKSIKACGFCRPIVVSEAGYPYEKRTICAGHTAWQAAKDLGIKTIPAAVVKFTKEQFAEYNISDNRTGELSDWDVSVLRDITEEFHFTEIPGFVDSELEVLLSTDLSIDPVIPKQTMQGYKNPAAVDFCTIRIRVSRELSADVAFRANLAMFCRENGFLQWTIAG